MARRTDIRIKTRVSKSGRAWFADPRSVKRINAGLLRAATRCRPLPLDGVSLVYHHIHIGSGLLRRRRDRRWHVHDEIQIEYAVFGKFLFRTRREERRIGPGEGLVVARQMEHGFDTIEDGGLVGVLVEIDGPRREEFIRHVDRCAGDGFLSFGSDECASWMDRALRMTAASDHTSWHTEMAADLLHLWLAQLAGEAVDLREWLLPEDTAIPPNREQRKMLCDRALRFMRANCTRRIGLRDIAQHVGISPRHLGRLFHDVLGDSVNSALVRLRLERAHAMLSSESSLLVKQVALATGFTSPAYFTHCFRRTFGCLPRDVRNEGSGSSR